jgi:hypothetical protein
MSDHYAFSRHYPSLVRSLATEARVCKEYAGNPEESLAIRAIWDTGANGIVLKNKRITICKLPPAVDMLIGMDIISMGDLFICNANDRTLFSYALPPLPGKIDLVDRAEESGKGKSAD